MLCPNCNQPLNVEEIAREHGYMLIPNDYKGLAAILAFSQTGDIRVAFATLCQSYFGAGRCDISGELCKEEARREKCNLKE